MAFHGLVLNNTTVKCWAVELNLQPWFHVLLLTWSDNASISL